MIRILHLTIKYKATTEGPLRIYFHGFLDDEPGSDFNSKTLSFKLQSWICQTTVVFLISRGFSLVQLLHGKLIMVITDECLAFFFPLMDLTDTCH